MLKRLIIAVFGIGLLLSFGSTAFAGPDLRTDLSPVEKSNPNAARFGEVDDARPTQPSFKKPASAIRQLPPGTDLTATPSLIYFCDAQSYTGTWTYVWTLPDAYGDDLFNTRFTVEDGFDCTLKVAHYLMYEGIITGSPDFRAYLWADDGFGFPGALLDSVDISNATILTTFAAGGGNVSYLSADFSAAGWVFSDGDEYHYGWTPIGGAGDTLSIISDDAAGPFSGEERSSEYYSGAWGSMLNDWGADYVFEIVSERCCSEIPFSDCYVQSYWQNITYLWRIPHQTYGDEEFAMRFDVGGPETLASVDFYIYDDANLDPVGNNDIYVNIREDDGFGLPGALITSVTLPATTYSFFPAVTSVPFAPLVLDNTFHVGIATDGVSDFVTGVTPGDSYESILSSDGSDGTGRSSSYWAGGPWFSMLAGWGLDVNLLIDVFMCRDEFAQCSTQPGCNVGINFFWRQPDIYGDVANGQFIPSPGEECRVKEVSWAFYWGAADSLLPLYERDTKLSVYSDAGGLPGSELYSTNITVADYGAPFAGIGAFLVTKDVEALEWDVSGNYWIVTECLTTDPDSGIRVLSDAGGGGCDRQSAELYLGVWENMCDGWGVPCDLAFVVDVDQCCIPFAGAVCNPPDANWSVRSHDLSRTGRSQLAISDAWCDLNVDWFADDLDAASSGLTMGPVIHDGHVYQIVEHGVSGSFIRVFDLATGALEQTLSGANIGNFAENDPLVVGSKLYISGGDNRIVSRYDVSVDGAAVLDWTRTIHATAGPLRRANLMLVDVGGTGVLYSGTQLGRAFAINEADGLDYAGWGSGTPLNPLTLDAGQLVQGTATDGNLVYFLTRQSGLDGNVWALDPATGAVVWDLASGAGLQADLTVFPGLGNPILTEGFTSAAIEGDVLYVGSNCQTSNFPADGVFYRLNKTTGAVNGVSAGPGFLFSNPIIDINLVYCQSTTRWVAPPYGGDMVAYNKLSGALVWASEEYWDAGVHNGTIRRYYNNGLLTCEPEPDPDIIVNADERGVLHFWNSIDGTEMFRRRFDFGPGAVSIAGGTAIGTDSAGATHILCGSNRGALVSLSKGADRPRLEIENFDPTLAVEFSVLPSAIYTEENIIVNTGCADLNFLAVNVDTTAFGSTDPGIAPFTPVRPGLLDASTLIAGQIAKNAAKFKNVQNMGLNEFEANSTLLASSEESLRDERNYRAALVIPAYLNGVVEPFAGQVLAGGDSLDLVLDVNPSLINRGPQAFYIELVTDDADYFLNAGSVDLPNDYPDILVTLVGGCLIDSTALHFGLGGDDFAWATNSIRIADSDWNPYGVQYNGEIGYIFQATYVFGVSTERIAMNVKNWFGQPEENSWYACQADPNYCDSDCKPALITGVNLGALWNGATYDPIVGNMICKSWVDSVQNYSNNPATVTPGDWYWRNYGAPFNDSLTMGLSANARAIGVEDVPEFANFYVEIFDVTERNGNDVPDWKFGEIIDYDAAHFVLGGTHDTLVYDISSSATWTTSSADPNADYAFGTIKLPFGCGYTPMVNGKSLDSDQGQFEDDPGIGRGNPYWDSVYTYLSYPLGTEAGHPVSNAAQDEQSHSTLAWNDFGPNETYSFASVQFGFDAGVTDPLADGGGGEISALANFANKWVGFGRGDVNNDDAINLGDIMTLAAIVNGDIPGAIPFEHLADVDADSDVDNADLQYMIDYYFGCGPCPLGNWQF